MARDPFSANIYWPYRHRRQVFWHATLDFPFDIYLLPRCQYILFKPINFTRTVSVIVLIVGVDFPFPFWEMLWSVFKAIRGR
ncbi:hypothetical protein F5Y05DRAFT_240307 [Hypoxylon sp. FL0543]|nr:hypothetical protein F5Y05DRAFT_240307 [Hypoxylon sp. FL0543]